MLKRSRSSTLGVFVAAAVFLAVPAAAQGDPALPVSPPAPPVSVTPTGDGLDLAAGTGDAGVNASVGPSGVTVGTRPSLPPISGLNALTRGVPIPSSEGTVRGPGFRTPGGHRGGSSPRPQGGSGATVIGPDSHGPGRSSPDRSPRSRVGAGPELGLADAASAEKRNQTRSAPFFDFVDRIPAAFRAALIGLGLIALAVWGAWVRARRRLSGNAYVDPDTGVANAIAFERILDGELARAKRYKRQLGLLMLDLAERERAGGRRIPLLGQGLLDATATISEAVRPADTVARLGQSKFAVICPEATEASVKTLARAIESKLEELRVHAVASFSERLPGDRRGTDLVARARALPAPAESEHAPGGGRRAVLRAA